MFFSDIDSFARGLLAEPYTDRFSEAQMYQWISQAQREIARETRCFEGRKCIQLQPNLQEYPLPKLVGIKRVYVAGPGWAQRITHTSIPQMEGDQLRIYDQSGTGSTTAQPNSGNVTGAGMNTFTPVWLTLPPAPYPVENSDFGIGYNPLPMIPGRRPQYYLRGIGRIGLVPPPIASYFLVLDIAETTEEIDVATVTSLESPFPDDFKEALSWYTLHFAYHSDQSVGADSLAADAMANYMACLAKMQSFVHNINEDDPEGPYMLTHRAFYEAAATGPGWYGGHYD